MQKSEWGALWPFALCCGGPLLIALGVAVGPVLAEFAVSSLGLAATGALVVVGLVIAVARRRALPAGPGSAGNAEATVWSCCEPEGPGTGETPTLGDARTHVL